MEELMMNPVKRKRGRPKGSKNKNTTTKVKTPTSVNTVKTAPAPKVIQPVISEEYNDVIYMPLDSILEKFGDMPYVAVSASWVKDNLISTFISETKSLKTNPKTAPEKELNSPVKSLDSEEEDAKVEFNLTEF